ncbi:MAG TPA: PfkB family carbohydrate kinase [Solirubrobacteraceae bacterium]|nr:PfkB family carbohydrate kinase [Solirubrobacteraceae bacterium]
MPTLCLGEALVDLVCERPVASLVEAGAFVPHFGGAVANVAVAAARIGAPVALAGGTGDDAWGDWLRDRLAAEGVDLEWFAQAPGLATPIAFVALDASGEPSYSIYGEGIEALVVAAGPGLDEAVEECDALFFSSNTLAGAEERELTLRARERALELDRPVLFDPNLRLHRWDSVARAVESANACVPDAMLVRCNRAEAQALTGEADPEAGARALVAAGARMAVVTLGPDGALLRGEVDADVPGVPARAVSTVGAGDALMGVLVGRLTLAAFYAPAVAAALPEAVEASARATERWGAV